MTFLNHTPKVTVIVPTYNKERFIRATLESALSQAYEKCEIVVIDDGSTDTTPSILDSYRDKLTILEHPYHENRGQSAAINLALRSTESEYVAILDSDDIWHSNKLEWQVRVLQENPSVGLVYSNGMAIDENGAVLYSLFPSDHSEWNKPERVLLEAYYSVHSNALIRRSAIELAGEFDEGLRSAQDHDMAIRLAEVTTLAYLPQTLWLYRRHSDTQSIKHARRRWELGFYILRKACARYHYPLNVRRRRLAVLFFRLGQCLWEEWRVGGALVRFALAGLLDPIRAWRVLMGREIPTAPH